MFPFDYRSRVSWKDVTADEQKLTDRLLIAFAQRLDELQVGDVVREGPVLSFEVPFFRLVSNWNMLSTIDKGEISVRLEGRTVTVEYWVSFNRFLVFTALIVLSLGGFTASQGFPLLWAGALAVGCWLWLFGMNLALFLPHFRFWIEQTVQLELRWDRCP